MAQPIVPIPIEHQPAIYEVETETNLEPKSFTLLELIDAVSQVAETEEEVIATVSHMLNSGRVKLSGNFRDAPVESLCGEINRAS